MKNDNIIWAKTVLSVYRYLERIGDAIDKIILKSALNSSNILGNNYFQNNVMSITQKLIDLSQRKVTLINLKVLTEDTLAEIDHNDAVFLIEKFFDGEKVKDLMQKHNISLRTVFRKLDCATKAFSSRLCVKGYSSEKLLNMLKDENWILNVYSSLSTKNVEELSLSNHFLERAVSM